MMRQGSINAANDSKYVGKYLMNKIFLTPLARNNLELEDQD